MQTIAISNVDNDDSTAMTLDDTASIPLKKRPLDVDETIAEQHSSSSALPSPAKIQAINPDNTGSCDITWQEVLHLLAPLRNYEPTFLSLIQLQQNSRWVITEEVHQALGRLRERTYMPHTFARDRFDSWHAGKAPDECLTVPQLDTVLHFLDIIYTECYMAIDIRTHQDKTELLHHLIHASPEDDKALIDALRVPFDDHIAAEIQNLQDMAMNLLRTMTRQPRHITSWAGRLAEANRYFADLTLADTPVSAAVADDHIPLDPSPTVAVAPITPLERRQGTPASYLRQAMPSTTAILGDPTYNSVITVTKGWTDSGNHTVNFRTDGSSLGHPPDSGLAHDIRTRTLADKFTFWGQFLSVTGFYPTRSVETTLRDLQTTVGRIGTADSSASNDLLVDEDWVRENHVTNHWAVYRGPTPDKPSFYIVKLQQPALFGTFFMPTPFDGTIVPITSQVRGFAVKKRTYFFTAIPAHVPMKTFHLVEKYKPILAVRSSPIDKDRNVLTNAFYATLYIVLSSVLPGQFVILPHQHYQPAIITRHRGREHFVHPDQDEASRVMQPTSVRDLIWEVLLIVPDEYKEGTVEDRTQECQQIVFRELAKARKDSHALSPPFLAHAGGFQYEYMQCANDFLASPRGPPGLLVPSGVRIYNVPHYMLAKDALNILAQEQDNWPAILSTRGAIVVPPVPYSEKQNYWRLFLLGDVSLSSVHLGPLDRHMVTHFPGSYGVHMSAGPIEGLHTYIMLRTMYENYYSGRDLTTTGHTADAMDTVPTVTDTGTSLTNVTAQSVSVWKAPSSVPEHATRLDPDFPPLPVQVMTPVQPPASGDLTRFNQQVQLDSYFNTLLDKKLDDVRQETTRALELITAKTDSALASMGNRLSLQERTMVVSALQNRVDPINRAHDALVSLQRHVQGLLKERKKIARSPSPDIEELADMDEQIGSEQDDIAKAKSKLRQRHAALVHEAQLLNITLHDLVDLDFRDGPA